MARHGHTGAFTVISVVGSFLMSSPLVCETCFCTISPGERAGGTRYLRNPPCSAPLGGRLWGQRGCVLLCDQKGASTPDINARP